MQEQVTPLAGEVLPLQQVETLEQALARALRAVDRIQALLGLTPTHEAVVS